MREIDFRAKLKKQENIDLFGEWFYGDLIHYADGSVYIRQKETGTTLEAIQETVGQYWRTINGQKLYDGDIFESTKYKSKWIVQYREDEERFCIAHPEEFHLKYVNPWQSPDKKWWIDFEKDFQIVGNIYDNPELI